MRQTFTKTTKGLVFGFPEAEGEIRSGGNAHPFPFKDYLGLLPQISNGRFIVLGRKGTGKSAIVKYFSDTAQNDNTGKQHAHTIRGGDIHLERFLNREESVQSGAVSFLFEWSILCGIAKILVRTNSGAATDEFSKLRDFLERNRGMVDIDKMKLTEAETLDSLKVNFEVLRHRFGGIIDKAFKKQYTCKLPHSSAK